MVRKKKVSEAVGKKGYEKQQRAAETGDADEKTQRRGRKRVKQKERLKVERQTDRSQPG